MKPMGSGSRSLVYAWTEICQLRTIARFRGSHAHVNIVIFDPEELPFRQNESDFTQ